MAKSKASKVAPAHALVNASVNATRSRGEIFLPVSAGESSDLLSLLPGFRSSLPSIFRDTRYEASDTMSTDIFTVDPLESAESEDNLPASYYPITLVEACPRLGRAATKVTYAEGRLLYLALSFVIETVHPVLDIDRETELVLPSVSDKQFFKQCLGLAEPALVRSSIVHSSILLTFFYRVTTSSTGTVPVTAPCSPLYM